MEADIVAIELRGIDVVRNLISSIPNRLFPLLKSQFQYVTFGLQREMQARVSGDKLMRRTGQLARSFIAKVGGSRLGNLFGLVETDSKYAKIHEFGGTIRPTNARFLTIPTEFNKTAAGVMRKNARQLMSEGKSFFQKSRNGNLMLFTQTARGQLKPMFMLKESVTIPARLGFRETAEKWLEKLKDGLQNLMRSGI